MKTKRLLMKYCQESSSDDENRTDSFAYSKKKVDTFKETLLNHKNPTEDSLFYAICYTSRQQKNRKRICVLTVI